MKMNFAIRLFAWGLAILSFVTVLWSMSFFFDWEKALLNNWRESKENRSRSTPPSVASESPASLNTLTILLITQAAGRERYLAFCASLVEGLKGQGASSVLMFFPDELLATKRNTDLVERIRKTGIAVFGRPPMARADRREAAVPFYGRSGISWGVLTTQRNEFVPYDYKESYSQYMVPDVALRLVGKMKGYADDKPVIVGTQSVKFGDFDIPVFPDGTAFLSPIRWGAGFVPWDFFLPMPDSGAIDDFTPIVRSMAEPTGQRLDATIIKSRIKDKVVVIAWTSQFVDAPLVSLLDCRKSVESILNKQFIEYERQSTPAVILPLLILAGFIAYHFRPLVSIVVLFVLLFLLCGVAYWLLNSHSVFIQVLYPALSLVLCVAVFPAVKLAMERKELDQENEQLEKEEKARMQKELQTAHDMQMGLMPTSDPAVEGFDISGLCRPAEEVGGDYFDYVWLDDGKTKLGIAIADVSGKAMKAAMTAVMTSGMVYRELGSNETPKTILRKINRPMYFKTDKRIFTAMSFAVIDTVTKSLAFSNAGQMQPLLKRNGKIESLKVEGARLPLGMAEDVEYNELTVSLQGGDTLVFYTDGIPEAINIKNEMFGFERLEVIVKESTGDLSAKQVAAKIVGKVAEFAGATKQHDDMTVVVVRVL